MTRNERFNHRLVRLDALPFLIEKGEKFSDNGLGVDRVVDSIDRDEEAEAQLERRLASEFYQKLCEAKRRLKKAGKRYLIRVFLLIVKNNYKRQESLKYVPKMTYYRHRDELIMFFCGTFSC